jgi:hypothetical protein
MKNGKEIRANGVVITKTQRDGSVPQYHVEGSKNGPWDYLQNARDDADTPAPRLTVRVTTAPLFEGSPGLVVQPGQTILEALQVRYPDGGFIGGKWVNPITIEEAPDGDNLP